MNRNQKYLTGKVASPEPVTHRLDFTKNDTLSLLKLKRTLLNTLPIRKIRMLILLYVSVI